MCAGYNKVFYSSCWFHSHCANARVYYTTCTSPSTLIYFAKLCFEKWQQCEREVMMNTLCVYLFELRAGTDWICIKEKKILSWLFKHHAIQTETACVAWYFWCRREIWINLPLFLFKNQSKDWNIYEVRFSEPERSTKILSQLCVRIWVKNSFTTWILIFSFCSLKNKNYWELIKSDNFIYIA
jgi:hypothetical protein